MAVKNKVQLITYPDSLGGNLKSLKQVLEMHFNNVFKGGIHILPPFPSSGDRGFAPLTYLNIEPEFGSWDDIKAIAENHDILVDLMVNHISAQSEWFQDYLKKGANSEFRNLFITLDKIWDDGKPVQEDIDRMFLRRKLPISTFASESGEELKVWTTFGKQDPSEQIDIDINSREAKNLFVGFLKNFSENGVKIVRLDAVGYITKKTGTSCFFVEPEIYDFMEWVNDIAKSLDIELLPEVHSHYSIQYKLAEKGYWIYDFILPYMILEALQKHSGERLIKYLRERPEKQFTMLDCHDGIPVKPDLDDLVSTRDAQKVVDQCLEYGANLSKIYSDKHKSEDGFDVHQIRCSYYSALGENNDAYLAARAIQLFTPGIPQVYYVTMLGGKNDVENVMKTGEGREINRHNFTMKEINDAVLTPLVQRQIRLIHFRNEHPAFDGVFSAEQMNTKTIQLKWQKEAVFCSLSVNLETGKSVIIHTDNTGEEKQFYI